MVDLQQLRETYQETQSLKQTAIQLGKSKSQISRLMTKHYPELVRPADRYKGTLQPTTEELHQWYIVEKQSLRDIARHCGSDASRVRKQLLGAGITPRDRTEHRVCPQEDPDLALVHQLYDEGYGIRYIARTMGYTQDVMRTYLKNLGILIPHADRLHVPLDGRKTRFKRGFIPVGPRKLLYESSYEERFIQDQLKQHSEISRWTRSPIPYHLEETLHRYTPDFVLHPNTLFETLVEVKPLFLLMNPRMLLRTKAGFDYAMKHGMLFWIVTEADLEISLKHSTISQSRTNLQKWLESVERAANDPFFQWLGQQVQRLDESNNLATKPHTPWFFHTGDKMCADPLGNEPTELQDKKLVG